MIYLLFYIKMIYESYKMEILFIKIIKFDKCNLR